MAGRERESLSLKVRRVRFGFLSDFSVVKKKFNERRDREILALAIASLDASSENELFPGSD